ncbi:MAG: hypothetical protein IPK60_06585 [Sandaracinaceae bacterium]|nr:hypothetical protein [Sandaracinaceae bacterium]
MSGEPLSAQAKFCCAGVVIEYIPCAWALVDSVVSYLTDRHDNHDPQALMGATVIFIPILIYLACVAATFFMSVHAFFRSDSGSRSRKIFAVTGILSVAPCIAGIGLQTLLAIIARSH